MKGKLLVTLITLLISVGILTACGESDTQRDIQATQKGNLVIPGKANSREAVQNENIKAIEEQIKVCQDYKKRVLAGETEKDIRGNNVIVRNYQGELNKLKRLIDNAKIDTGYVYKISPEVATTINISQEEANKFNQTHKN